MTDSSQQRVGRIRPPRVQITYDVEDGGGTSTRELPLVAGIVGDLSGDGNDPVDYAERDFVEVEQGGVEKLMKRIGPTLKFSVADKLSAEDGAEIGVELNFESMDDFSPMGVAAQVPQTAKLLEARRWLADLYGKIESNEKLDVILSEVLSDDEKQAQLRAELGIDENGSAQSTENQED